MLSVVERGKKALRELEERREKARRLFDIDQFIADADKTREVEVPELNIIVRYKPLTNEDLFKVMKIEDDTERGIELLYLMLSKADPKITREKLKKLNPLITAQILNAITSKEPLFLARAR